MLLRKVIKGIIDWLKKLWFEAKLQARLDKIEREYKIKFDKELKESFEPIFEQKPHEDPNSEAAKLGGEISLKAKWLEEEEEGDM